MPTNTEFTLSLVAGTVPPDRNCPKNGQEVLNLMQDFGYVQGGTASGDGGNPNDSIAEQALNTANTALAAVQNLQAAQKEVRSSGIIPINSGDQIFSYSFTPPMPSEAYFIDVTYYGQDVAVPDQKVYNWRVLEDTITVNGFTLRFDNTPVDTKVAIRVTQQ